MTPNTLPTAKSINDIARDWSHDTLSLLLDRINELHIVDTGTLFRQLKYRMGYSFGEVEKIAYGFPRYGVFVEKGVGRGRPIGSTSAKQNARKWFNPTLDKTMPDLAQRLADGQANVAIRSIKIN